MMLGTKHLRRKSEAKQGNVSCSLAYGYSGYQRLQSYHKVLRTVFHSCKLYKPLPFNPFLNISNGVSERKGRWLPLERRG
jgi:hypothetical protein